MEHANATASEHPQRQVLRTLNKKPIKKAQFTTILKDIEERMSIRPGDEILDLCCGNGLITKHLASKCKHVVGVDFASGLADQIEVDRYQNISVVVEDIRRVDFKEASFDKIIIYAGLQYLSYKETIYLFESMVRWLKDRGLLYIGDVPDQDRLWNFFNTDERAQVYFESVRNDKPIVGTWFSPSWLAELGKYTGFQNVKILFQSESLPYAHYRFDMILQKL